MGSYDLFITSYIVLNIVTLPWYQVPGVQHAQQQQYNITRVTKSYLLALGTTQTSSFFTKHWTSFQLIRQGITPWHVQQQQQLEQCMLVRMIQYIYLVLDEETENEDQTCIIHNYYILVRNMITTTLNTRTINTRYSVVLVFVKRVILPGIIV